MPRKPAKKKHEFPLLAHADKLMARLHELTPAALEAFDAEAIHQARVATRRLKAALDLMTPVLSKRHRKPLADGLRRLRRRLGPLRDADVLVDRLCELRKDDKHARAAGWLAGRLSADRQRLRDETRQDVSARKELRRVEAWPVVRQEIVEAREAVDALLAESLHLQTDAFAEQADRLVADLEGTGAPQGNGEDVSGSAAPSATAEDAPDLKPGDDAPAASGTPARRPRQNPHDLRIAGKALRYTLEMAEVEGHAPGAAVMKQFKRMQELLGTWHDHVVLADQALLAVARSELAHADADAAERAIELGRHAVRRSAQDLTGFVKLWKQQGAKLAARIRAAFPLVRSVAASSATPESGGSILSPDGTACDAPTSPGAGSPLTGFRTGPGPSDSAAPGAPAAAP